MSKILKNFYLLSFLPAIAYWYLESYYPLNVAVIGGLILATVELTVEKIFTKHVHTLSVFNLFVIMALGGISLIGQEGIWFKLQPFFTRMAICGFLLFKLITSEGLMAEMMRSMSQKNLPVPMLRMIEGHFAIFTFLYSIFMAYVALFLSTDIWLFFKTAGFYLCFFTFMVLEMFFLRFKMRRLNHKIVIKDGKRF
jgi:intracellular septation protein